MELLDNDIIAHLNAVLKSKLTAINQYFLHARMLKHQGNVALADYEYKASIDAMKHADMLIEHILSSGGRPDLQGLDSLSIGDSSRSMLEGDMVVIGTTLDRLKAATELCESRQNKPTAALLARILDSQKQHKDFIQNQLVSNPLLKDCA